MSSTQPIPILGLPTTSGFILPSNPLPQNYSTGPGLRIMNVTKLPPQDGSVFRPIG